MKTAIKLEPMDVNSIPFQEASLDIWDKKYRLSAKDGTPIDRSMDDTYKRVARALADVEREDVREHWYEHFLWALRHGTIPAGRITSNAGAQEHKPATSTINCTVSGTIHDSMDDILDKVHEAGLTLKAGCGIGYEFSTLRPRGAYVSGAGAYTSGPAVVHGYLRQDVLHRVLGRRPPRRADGHVRRRPSGRDGFHPRQARRRPPAPVQPVAADHRRVHAGGEGGRGLEAGVPGHAARSRGRRGPATTRAKYVWREWPTHARLRRRTTRAWSAARSTRRCRRAACGT